MRADSDNRRFEEALSTANPTVALHEMALTLKAEGLGQAAMYRLFEEYPLRTDGEDPKFDAIADNMDLIWGGAWAKGRALFETELTHDEVARD